MAKKISGLGRGLGDLFEDNAAELRTSKGSVIIRTDSGEKDMRPSPDLYEKKPKNRSVYLNYKDKDKR